MERGDEGVYRQQDTREPVTAEVASADGPGAGRAATAAGWSAGRGPARSSRTGVLRHAAEPSTWVALAVLALPFSSSSGPTAATVTPSDLLIVLAALVAGWTLLQGRQLAVVRSVAAVPLLVLAALTCAAGLVAGGFPGSMIGAARYVELFFLAPIAVMVALRTRRDAVVVVGSVVGLAVVEGAIGVFQTLTRTGASIGGEYIRAVGTFGAYNILALAELCALGLVVCLAFGVILSGWARWTALASAAGLAVPLALSLSRGAWVAAAVAVVVVISRGRLERLLVAAGVLAVTTVSVVPLVVASGSDLGRRLASLTSVLSSPDQSFTDRLELWGAAARMALDHPWTGVGPRAFAEHRDAYAGLSMQAASDISIGNDFQQVALESPHSFYLLVASEQGLVVAVAYTTVLVLLLTRGLARASRPRSDLSTAVSLAGAGALAYQLVGMVTGDLGGPGSILVAVTVGLAAWAAADRDLVLDEDTRDDRVVPPDSAVDLPVDGGKSTVRPRALAAGSNWSGGQE